MKKILAIIMSAALCVGMAGCSNNEPPVTNDFNYKVGVASFTHANKSYGYTEGKNGRGAVTTTNVAAVFDQSGKIVKISIDEIESNIGFDGKGQLVGFTGGEIKSKKEQGDSYGMKAASSIGKEWYQQVESLEKWLIGKNANDIIGSMTTPSSSSEMSPKNGTSYTNYSRNATMTNSSSDSSMTKGEAMDNTMIDNMTPNGNFMNDMFGGVYTNTWMDEDVRAGVTIDTTYMRYTIQKAYRNAK